MFPPVRKIAAKHTLRGLMATPGPEKSTEWGNRANRATDIRDSIYGHEIEMYTVEQGEKRDKRQ